MKYVHEFIKNLNNIFQKIVRYTDSSIWLKIFIQVIVILSCTVYLYINLQKINFSSLRNQWNMTYFVFSIIGFIAAVFVGAIGWWTICKSFGLKTSILIASQIHTKANISKYAPGYGWQLIGKLYLSSKIGWPKKYIATAMAVEFLLIYLSGLTIAVWIIPSQLLLHFGVHISPDVYNPIFRLLSILVMIITPLLLKRIIDKRIIGIKLNITGLFLSTALMFFGWAINAIGFWFLISAISPISIELFNISTFVILISFLLGFLIFFIPGSIGVRESIIVFLFSFLLPGYLGAGIAILQRIAFIVADLSGYTALEFISYIYKRRKVIIQNNPNG